MSADLEARLIALERRLLEPAVRGSTEALDRLIDDDFEEIGASGVRFDKRAALERLPTEAAPRFVTQDFELRSLADGIAQLLYRATIERPGEDCLYSLRSSIWRRHADGWRMLFHQGTPCEPFDRNREV